jgi:hypothetical protein
LTEKLHNKEEQHTADVRRAREQNGLLFQQKTTTAPAQHSTAQHSTAQHSTAQHGAMHAAENRLVRWTICTACHCDQFA